MAFETQKIPRPEIHREAFVDGEVNTELIAPRVLDILRRGEQVLRDIEGLKDAPPLDRVKQAKVALLFLRARQNMSLLRSQYESTVHKLFPTETRTQEEALSNFEDLVYQSSHNFSVRGHFDKIRNGMVCDDPEGLQLMYQAYLQSYISRHQASRFCEEASKDLPNTVLGNDTYKELCQVIREARKELMDIDPPKEIAAFPEDVQREIVSNLGAIELSKGCSVGCSFCAFSKEKGPSAHIPFQDAVWYQQNSRDWCFRPRGQRVNKPLFYFGSEPFDFKGKLNGQAVDYADLAYLFADDPSHTTTALPKNSDSVMRRALWDIDRISVGTANKKRLVKEGLFHVTEKDSVIVKNPDLVHRFGYHLQMNAVQNQLIPEHRHFSGRERSKKRHESEEDAAYDVGGSIACFQGVVVSPGHLRNSLPMLSSDWYENGVAEAEITLESIRAGHEKLMDLRSRVNDLGEEIQVETLLPYGVIRIDTRARARYLVKDSADTDRFPQSRAKPEEIHYASGDFTFYTFSFHERADGKIESIPRSHLVSYDINTGVIDSIHS